jgi:hypothetical protein
MELIFMERFLDEDGKWAWKFKDKEVVRPSEKQEEVVVVKDEQKQKETVKKKNKKK